MAIIPSNQFPGQVDNTDPTNYPHGKAQNDSGPSATDGTPWVAVLLNDLWGFLQALLDVASITPSDTPDSVAGGSQYLQAIQQIARNATRYNYGESGSTSASFNSTNHMAYTRFTNAGAITVTMDAPVAPYGDSILIEKGGGDITVNGAGGITIELESGASNVVDVADRTVALISKDATTWKMIV